ncbi:MAG: hypothetical protein V4656_14615 [Pseudomonadota bacterium]
MTDVSVLGVKPDLDLTELNAWVTAREQTMAPVIGIAKGATSNGKPETAVSFDLDQDTLETNFARVKLKVGNAPVLAPNEVLVCEGKAYISGALTPVFLVRKKT